MQPVKDRSDSIYTSGEYLQSTRSWHVEDSPWKAGNIAKILTGNGIQANTIAEIGCGAGAILEELAMTEGFADVRFEGYDISPQAIEIASTRKNKRISFLQADILTQEGHTDFDVLLAIDVFEHIPDYIGFLEACREKARYKVFHIPLDLHVSSVLRNTFMEGRYSIGHLHYFTADSAIATLHDAGYEVIDSFYTNAAMDLFYVHPSLRKALANGPRWFLSLISDAFSARLLGGYSLMVLAV